ncbi:MAG: membrane protein insertion efficiency factor YidD [Rhodospirillaceae bacterium]|nr:membrane protein insertion efficiency factor YidD [Rhodospirillaceae bacterium]
MDKYSIGNFSLQKSKRFLLVWLLKAAIRAYRYTLSSLIGNQCRYYPTCSVYAIEALDTHGTAVGLRFALKRLARCHPWGQSGVDPVPPKILD